MSSARLLTRSPRAHYLAWLTALYALAITAISHVPGSSLERLGVRIWDRGAHFTEYLLLGFLLTGWIVRRPLVANKGLAAILGWLAVSTFGALDEVHQYFVPGRYATLLDCAADSLGGAAGAVLAIAVLRINQSRSGRTT